MKHFKLKSLLHTWSQSGQGLVEYALIIALVAVVVIGALLLVGPALERVYSQVLCALDLQSDIRAVTVGGTPPTLSVNVDVRRSTQITISGDASGGGPCNGGVCTYSVNAPNHGSMRITASGGGCYYAFGW